MKAVLPAIARPLLEPHLPAGLDVAWFASEEDAAAMARDAEIVWADLHRSAATAEVLAGAERLKWAFTLRAGVDALDTDLLVRRGAVLTNGSGINAHAVAEYAVMGVLVAAKRYDRVVRMADAGEWPVVAPGAVELFGSSALVIGYGAIGALIGERLAAFGVAVTGVTRSGRDGTLTPGRWRARLGDFDWVILAAPATDDTAALIGADELAAMKPSAWLVNVARGELVDQDALVAALAAKGIAGAFLDTVAPEPLPAGHPLWTAPDAILTMHLSGRSQTTMFAKAVALFLDNLDAFLAGRPLKNTVDPAVGY